jgi:hypothetical protein
MSEAPPSHSPTTSRYSAVIGGIILIGIGVIFLLQNIGLFYIGNWWALFILLGTAGAWGSAWHVYQNNGHLVTPGVTGSFMNGLFPLAVALIFLLDLNWGTVWPVFLIIAGLSVLARSFAASN